MAVANVAGQSIFQLIDLNGSKNLSGVKADPDLAAKIKEQFALIDQLSNNKPPAVADNSPVNLYATVRNERGEIVASVYKNGSVDGFLTDETSKATGIDLANQRLEQLKGYWNGSVTYSTNANTPAVVDTAFRDSLSKLTSRLSDLSQQISLRFDQLAALQEAPVDEKVASDKAN